MHLDPMSEIMSNHLKRKEALDAFKQTRDEFIKPLLDKLVCLELRYSISSPMGKLIHDNFSDRFEKCIELNHDLFIHNHGLDNQSLIMFPISIPVSNYLNIDGWFEFVEFTIIIKFETKTIKVYKDRTLMFNAISVQQAIEFCLNYIQYKSAIDINNGIDVMENYKNIMKSFSSIQTLLSNKSR